MIANCLLNENLRRHQGGIQGNQGGTQGIRKEIEEIIGNPEIIEEVETIVMLAIIIEITEIVTGMQETVGVREITEIPGIGETLGTETWIGGTLVIDVARRIGMVDMIKMATMNTMVIKIL